MKYNILQNWNLARVVRLALGIFMMVEGIQSETWMFVGLGVLFSIMPLLNIGCCASGNCSVHEKKKSNKNVEEVIYEEIK